MLPIHALLDAINNNLPYADLLDSVDGQSNGFALTLYREILGNNPKTVKVLAQKLVYPAAPTLLLNAVSKGNLECVEALAAKTDLSFRNWEALRNACLQNNHALFMTLARHCDTVSVLDHIHSFTGHLPPHWEIFVQWTEQAHHERHVKPLEDAVAQTSAGQSGRARRL